MGIQFTSSIDRNQQHGHSFECRLAPTTILLLAVLALLLWQSFFSRALASEVVISGSSTVYPVSQKAVERYEKEFPGKGKFVVGFVGTGAGFRKLLEGSADMTGASRPISADELAAFRTKGVKFYELPIAFDALSVVVNRKNDWVDFLRVSELKKLWEPASEGRVLLWSDLRPEWPKEKIQLMGPGKDSGTFDFFTEAIVGKSGSARMDFLASEDDNVIAEGVGADLYGLGYFGHAYVEPHEGKLRAVPIAWDLKPGTGERIQAKPVEPSLSNVFRGTYVPLGRPLFYYVRADRLAEKQELREFLEWFLTENRGIIHDVGYQPLNEIAYRQDLERIKNGITGTAFEGHTTGAYSIFNILDFDPVEPVP